ncbi:MAG: aminopeptidase P family protein [bacterium]|nr:aminopeptidase P family protein [bacterium]
MHEKRVQNVGKVLRQEKTDALLVWNHEGSGQPATGWLSGFTGTSSILLIVREKILRPKTTTSFHKGGIRTYLITDGRYTAQSKKEAKEFTISITSGQMSALKILKKLIEREKIGKIIFDGSVTPYGVVEELKSSVSEDRDTSFKKGGIKKAAVELISRKRVLQELRVVKEKEELKLLAKAADIACRAFLRLIPDISVGMTEKEIAERLETFCKVEGAEGFAFPTCVLSGKNGALPHGKPTEKKIRSGELITIDFGVKYQGYVSDMTRTVVVGKISSHLRKIYEAVRKAQELGCKAAKAGVTGKHIDTVCRNYLAKQGFGKYFTHSTGHGIGMEVHELPIVSPHFTTPLREGSVITCEPGVYIPNVGGVRIEDALVLTKNGNINLTGHVSKELFVV